MNLNSSVKDGELYNESLTLSRTLTGRPVIVTRVNAPFKVNFIDVESNWRGNPAGMSNQFPVLVPIQKLLPSSLYYAVYVLGPQ